jgi:hypothetical protein
MKIAVVVFGQPRYIQSSASYFSHKFWLFGNDVKYFGHVWFDETLKKQDTTRIGRFVPPHNTEDLIRTRYKGISLKIERPLNFVNQELMDFAGSRGLSKEDVRVLSNTFSQLYSIHQALNQLKESPDDFDLVLLTRWDNFIYFLPPVFTIKRDKLTVAWSLGLSNKEKYGVADLLMIGSKKLILKTDAYPAISELLPKIGRQSAELYKWQCFLKSGTFEDLSIRRIVVAMLRDTTLSWPLIHYPLYNLKVKLRPKTRMRQAIKRIEARLSRNN